MHCFFLCCTLKYVKSRGCKSSLLSFVDSPTVSYFTLSYQPAGLLGIQRSKVLNSIKHTVKIGSQQVGSRSKVLACTVQEGFAPEVKLKTAVSEAFLVVHKLCCISALNKKLLNLNTFKALQLKTSYKM